MLLFLKILVVLYFIELAVVGTLVNLRVITYLANKFGISHGKREIIFVVFQLFAYTGIVSGLYFMLD